MSSLIVLVARFLWSFHYFLNEVLKCNDRFFHFSESDGMRWILYLLATYSVVLLSTKLLSQKKLSYGIFTFIEIMNFSIIIFPLMVPSKAFSFFMGVQNCSYAMSMHSLAFNHYFSKGKSSQQVSKHDVSFWTNLKTILAFGIPSRLKLVKNHRRRFPNVAMLFHGFVITLVGDACTYFIREWIPIYIQQQNQKWALSLMGALWQMCALEFAYWNIGVVCEYFGSPLTPGLLHKNPLLSTSLAEFWGIRWNPVISKQLQDSIYKPLRKVGVDRSVSVVACFTGSALIHAIPKLISEGSFEEFLMMFGFFFSQGFCLIIEFLMQRLIYKYATSAKDKVESNSNEQVKFSLTTTTRRRKSSRKDFNSTNALTTPIPAKNTSWDDSESYDLYMQSIRDNFFIELAVMLLFISGHYLIFEDRFQTKSLVIIDIVLVFYIFHRIIAIQSEMFGKSNKENRSIQVSKSIMVMLIVLGWLWTVTCFITQLPLYVLPMMTAISEFYSQSLVVGAFIRTLQKVYFLFVTS